MRRTGYLCLLALVVAGCGGGARQGPSARRIPAGLAHGWARRADAIAAAADAGDPCRASQLAESLQQDVIDRESSVPLRYRGILLRAANRLANGIVCTATVTTVVTSNPPHPHPHPPHPHHGPAHGPHGHHGPDGPPGPGGGGPGGDG